MRRRFFRRPGRMLGRMMAAGIPPLLIRSNNLMSDGEFTQAAEGLEQLARAAEARGEGRAPQFYLEAGRARLLAGQIVESVRLLEHGLGLMASKGRSHRLARHGTRIVAELRERGFVKEAQQVADHLKNLAPEFEAAVNEPGPVQKQPLPTRCPGCGAPVRPDEVEWLDAITAECDYCSSPIRTE